MPTVAGTSRSAPRPRVAPPAHADGTPPSDEAVRAYLPLVRWLVQRLAVRKPPQVELDEMVSWGIEGLLDAMKKYDPTKQAAFATYAQFRIRGAILDRLRGMDWVSRSVRQKASVLEKTYHKLEGQLGRPATEEEVADALGLSLPELHALLSEVGQMSLFSLEDLGVDAGPDRWQIEKLLDGDGTDPMQAMLSRERADLVAEAITTLPEKERTVIALYYHEGITMKEAGAVLGLTESRVSQLHAQALLRLRGLLHEHFGGAADGAAAEER
ncbi:MAG: FliA/WhiG family RNA polymerase sigma factor [Deltaproteobacteria bacterium]|nr:FliA/WhiG family RNA polymerase sigma factor [Deltaproteobacteria bacterium]